MIKIPNCEKCKKKEFCQAFKTEWTAKLIISGSSNELKNFIKCQLEFIRFKLYEKDIWELEDFKAEGKLYWLIKYSTN